MMTTTGDSFDANTELSDLLDEVRPTTETGGLTPEELAASDMEEEGSPIAEELEDEDDDDVDDEDFDDDEDDLDEEDEDVESDWDDEDEDDDDAWEEDDDSDAPEAIIDEDGCDDFEDAGITVEVEVMEVQCTDAAGDRVTLVEETITERMISAN